MQPAATTVPTPFLAEWVPRSDGSTPSLPRSTLGCGKGKANGVRKRR
jgi:hypothetical protein